MLGTIVFADNGTYRQIRMENAGFNNADRFAEFLVERAPVCQWLFNSAHRFYFISGDSSALFHHTPTELLGQHISTIDDVRGSWAARLEQVFSCNSLVEHSGPPSSGQSLIHIPICGRDNHVSYAAGFAYAPDHRIPATLELELAAFLVLQALETERGRTMQFLHDVVAQCMSGTGLQIDLLRMEAEGQGIQLTERAAELQRMLEDALQRVRQFSAQELGAGTN